MKKYFILFSLCLLFTSLVSAVPGIPHQFYGDVIVNGESSPDNSIIIASSEGETYMTVTKDGSYGYSPGIFYVEDPDGDRAGKTVFFYVGGKSAGSFVFENNGYTKLDFSLTTFCGDNYCLGNETCGNCETDCGICTEPPVINIISPENKVYDTNKIDLNVFSIQPLILWAYSLDENNFITFSPNITLTLDNGDYTLTVLGINKVYQTGKSEVSFKVNVPYCGDKSCSNGETCSTCVADCGACAGTGSSGSSSSGSSGGGGGGGGGIVKKNVTTNNTQLLATSTTSGQESSSENPEDNSEDKLVQNEENQNEKEESKNLFSGITGAFVNIRDKAPTLTYIVLVIFLIGIIITVFLIYKKNRKINSKLEISSY